ncbi:phage head-tail connector protein [Convivina praedatoris]|uniref:phage head-tail connector protein n=1 Tax=Convivina praedatoris TaxID=2880963 RepID=UPI00200D4E62|nr:phage head-tail connector protein [Convivina sp. LMG 32447]CAH1856753.1 hypothetical protein R077815_01478 [Convivina sp. LMG 32447]CAH1857140.1 hypothetical protein R078138_01513 [Convivina sp. LMG 32447]
MGVANDYVTLIDNESSTKDKLDIIECRTRERLAVLLGVDDDGSIPAKFNYIVADVSAARFSRIGNEGMKSANQDGLSMVFQDDDFSRYMSEINEYKHGYFGPHHGKVTFL